MGRIEELIAELCPDGVEYRTIDAIADCYSGATPNTKKPEYWENGAIPWMSSGDVNLRIVKDVPGRITYAGFNSCSTKTLPVNTVVIALAGQGKTRGKVALTKIELCTNQSLCGIVLKDSSILSEYLHRYLDSRYDHLRFISNGDGTRGGLTLKMIRNYEIPVPPIEVQREIVRILDAFAALTDDLTDQLAEEVAARKQQYAYYRERLLSRENLEALDGKPVEMVRIQDVCNKICSGGTPSSKVAEYYDGDIPWVRTQDVDYGLIEMPSATISKKGLDNSAAKWIPEGCVIVAMYGATAAKVAMNAIPVTTNQACCNLEVNLEKAFPKYVFHWLASSYEDLKALGEGSQNNISGAKVKSFPIPVPSLATQQRVVDILDRFDALTTSLTDGLPAEIEARRAQYGYYRDRLLDFPRKEVAAS